MEFFHSDANSAALTTKEISAANAPATPMKQVWSTIAKRFWNHTEATSKADTKSFEGLL